MSGTTKEIPSAVEEITGSNLAALMQINPEDFKPEELKFWDLNLSRLSSASGIVSYEKAKGFNFLDLTEHRESPVRKRCARTFDRIKSFGEYVKDQALEGGNQTRIYVHQAKATAVIDDHGSNPGWREHEASIDIPICEDFYLWAGHDGKWLKEETFQGIVDGALDSITAPDADEFLSTIQSLDVEGFKKRSEETTAAKKETIATMRSELRTDIPKVLSIKTRVFEDFEVEFVIRLRTRITNAMEVQFKFTILDRFELDSAIEEELFNRIEKESGIRPLAGSA